MNNSIPEYWVDTKLGSVIEYGKSTKKTLNDVDDSTWILELEDIEKGSSRIIKRVEARVRPFKSTKNTFKKGDILYGKLRPYLNKIVIANEDGVCSTEIIPIDAEPNCNNKYLFYWLKSSKFIDYVVDASYGVNMPRLGTKDGNAAPLILAPLAEQKEIANQLDSLLSKVDSIKNRLDAIPDIIKRFRQSVLASAVSGKLTEEWREKSPKSSWEALKLEQLILESSNGLSKRSGSKGSDVTILRLADFKNAARVLGNERQIKLEEKEQKKYALVEGDILIIRVNGSVDLAGRFIEYEDEGVLEGFCDHFIRLRIDKEKIKPRYLTYIANEGDGREYLQNSLSTSAGQNTINQGSVKGLKIQLPPIEEQIKIISIVNQLFSFADKVEQKVNAAQERVNNLTQSILAKAFRGELTAEWRELNQALITGENSAEALLAKIKAEREALSKKKAPKKKTTARKAKT